MLRAAVLQERATSEQILEHPWLQTSQSYYSTSEPANVSHQSANEIIDIMNRARERRAKQSNSLGPGSF